MKWPFLHSLDSKILSPYLTHYLPAAVILIFGMLSLHISLHSTHEQKEVLLFNQQQSENQIEAEEQLMRVRNALSSYLIFEDTQSLHAAKKYFHEFANFFEQKLGAALPVNAATELVDHNRYKEAQNEVRIQITKLAIVISSLEGMHKNEMKEKVLDAVNPLHQALEDLISHLYSTDVVNAQINDIEGHGSQLYWSVLAIGLAGFLMVLLNTDKMMRLRRSAQEREKYIADILKAEHDHKVLQDQFYQAQKMEAVGRMAGGIAHDFNNILAAMNGFAEFLVEDLKDDRELQKFALNILQAGQQARDLIDQLMTFSRRRSIMERHSMDLRALIDDNASIIKASMPRSIELSVRSSLRQAPMMGDQGQIAQALMNLCVNACDAIESGRGIIEIILEDVEPKAFENILSLRDSLPLEQDQPPLRIDDIGPGQAYLGLGSLSRDHAYIALSVRDNGSGISHTTMEQMFEPFFTTKPVNKGTGLGLSTVMGMVAAHQGALVVRSQVGQGSTFTILFPVLDSIGSTPIASAKEASAHKVIDKLSGKVLLVEDEPSVQAMMADLLQRLGMDVTFCDSGLEALDILREHPHTFDVVITDHNMPKMTGIELAFQAGIDFPGLPFVMITGYAEQELRDLVSEQNNIKALLRKPASREALAGAIADALGVSKGRKA
ncbi:MAG: response regulator [Alphaproteobacteria bacterium]|nr:response regulator [Alphaproteobacteria bacterium]